MSTISRTFDQWFANRRSTPTRRLARRRYAKGLRVERLEDRRLLTTVGYWTFDHGTPGAPASETETILDYSGNGLHGTALGAPVYRDIVGSVALVFDGEDDRVIIEDDPRFQLTQSLTLEAIVRIDSYANSGVIVWRGDDRSGNDPYAIKFDGDDHADLNLRRTIEFFIQPEGGRRTLINAPAPPPGEVFHVAGTLDDATGEWKLFINGVAVAETATDLRPFAELDPSQRPRISIGNIDQGGVQHFEGIIDEVRISDVALDPSQFSIPVWSTKFYVVNDASVNYTYEYDAVGGSIENYSLNSGNSAPRGAASTAAGDTIWVADKNRKVYVYDDDGALQGSWSAGTLSSRATVEGIATNGTDVWIVDDYANRVYRYANAAGRLSGSQNAASNFALNSSNRNPKGIVTDGTYIWVVNDTSTDKVFKYTTSGALVGSWTIDSANKYPTGLTIDPSNGSQDIWIVDSGTDKVYAYANGRARTSGSQSASAIFALAAGNTNPQGIADPPPISVALASALPTASSADDSVQRLAAAWIAPFSDMAPVASNVRDRLTPQVSKSSRGVDEFMRRLGSDWVPAMNPIPGAATTTTTPQRTATPRSVMDGESLDRDLDATLDLLAQDLVAQ
jgi:hypothetical protein